ncbi:MAG: hypothetical protein ACJA1B_002947 [Polaribacter sp.]|jgi:hypothetical protein
MKNTKEKKQEKITRKEAIKKIGNHGRYTTLTALGTYMFLVPYQAQTSSILQEPGIGF